MKYVLVVLALAFAFASPSHAAVTCADGREADAAQKISAVIQTGVVNLLKAKKIAVKDGGITVKGSIIINDDSDLHNNTISMYAMYGIDSGEVIAADGTKLSIDLSGDDYPNGVDYSFFDINLKSSGFDKEGNPLNAHCSLAFDEYVGYSNEAATVSISNEGSGHVIGSFAIPKTVSLY